MNVSTTRSKAGVAPGAGRAPLGSAPVIARIWWSWSMCGVPSRCQFGVARIDRVRHPLLVREEIGEELVTRVLEHVAVVTVARGERVEARHARAEELHQEALDVPEGEVLVRETQRVAERLRAEDARLRDVGEVEREVHRAVAADGGADVLELVAVHRGQDGEGRRRDGEVGVVDREEHCACAAHLDARGPERKLRERERELRDELAVREVAPDDRDR